jgi:hypothetical protein
LGIVLAAQQWHTARVAKPREVRIYAGEEPVISAALAAKRYGVSNATMRSTLARLRGSRVIEPVPEMLDERTPLYPLADLELAMGTRPGKGANLRQTEERPMPDLTPAMQPAYAVARAKLEPSGWPEDTTERAAREVVVELRRIRKEAGEGTIERIATDAERRRPVTSGLVSSLRAQGAEVTPIPIDRAVQFAAYAIIGVTSPPREER